MVTPKQTVFLFIGNDAYLKEKALQELCLSLPGNSAGRLERKIFRGGEFHTHEVFDHLTSLPLLSEKRIIVIKDIKKIPDDFRNSLIEYIRKPASCSYLILDAQDDSVLDDYKEVSNNISVRTCGMPAGASLVVWMKRYLQSVGKTIEDDALPALQELERNNLSYISQELDKLISFTGDRSRIGTDDVEEIMGKSLALSVFDITDAVGRKNVSRAVKISMDLIAEGKRESEIIGALSWHLKRLIRARIMKTRGESDYAITGFLRISSRFQGEFLRQLAGFNFERLKSGLETLLRGDLDIKRTKLDPGTILEMTLVRLCLL